MIGVPGSNDQGRLGRTLEGTTPAWCGRSSVVATGMRGVDPGDLRVKEKRLLERSPW